MSAKAYALDLFKWFLAAFILRSSACTVNDIFDRDFDAGVGQFFTLNSKYHNSHTSASTPCQNDAAPDLSQVVVSLSLRLRFFFSFNMRLE